MFTKMLDLDVHVNVLTFSAFLISRLICFLLNRRVFFSWFQCLFAPHLCLSTFLSLCTPCSFPQSLPWFSFQPLIRFCLLLPHTHTHTCAHSVISLCLLSWPLLAKGHTFSHNWSLSSIDTRIDTVSPSFLFFPQTPLAQYKPYHIFDLQGGVTTVYLSPRCKQEPSCVGLFLAFVLKQALNLPFRS